MRNIGIAQIAYGLRVTPNYLSTLFHKKMGTPFVKYLTRMRLTRAKELLLCPGARVQEVARQVGYQSARHFTKLFKQYWGSSPSQYKRV